MYDHFHRPLHFDAFFLSRRKHIEIRKILMQMDFDKTALADEHTSKCLIVVAHRALELQKWNNTWATEAGIFLCKHGNICLCEVCLFHIVSFSRSHHILTHLLGGLTRIKGHLGRERGTRKKDKGSTRVLHMAGKTLFSPGMPCELRCASADW